MHWANARLPFCHPQIGLRELFPSILPVPPTQGTVRIVVEELSPRKKPHSKPGPGLWGNESVVGTRAIPEPKMGGPGYSKKLGTEVDQDIRSRTKPDDGCTEGRE